MCLVKLLEGMGVGFPCFISEIEECVHKRKIYVMKCCLNWIRQAFFFSKYCFKGTVTQIEKALINNRLCISKASWKFCFPTIYNFAVIYQWNLLFS